MNEHARPAPSSERPQRARVLVADDDPVARLFAKSAIERLGFDVDITANGLDALELLDGATAPDVILLDWMMPNVDGLEVCRRIREREGDQPFIIVVTSKAPERLEEALRAGADDVLAKPVDVSALRSRMIRAHYALTRLGRASLAAAFEEAAQSQAGEIVVRASSFTMRILCYGSEVAWVHAAPPSRSVASVLASLGVEADAMRELMAESRRTGNAFVEVLLEWGLVDPDLLRDELRDLFVEEFDRLRENQQLTATFASRRLGRPAALSFPAGELAPWLLAEPSHVVSVRPPSAEEPDIVAALRDNLEVVWSRVRNASAVYVLDAQAGRCQCLGGDEVHEPLVRTAGRAFAQVALEATDPEEVIVRANDFAVIVRWLDTARGLSAALVVSNSKVSNGLARHSLVTAIDSARATSAPR